MFQLYDMNMNPMEYPEGLRPLDISISSIGKEVLTDTIEGVPGSIRYGSRDTDRSIQLKFFIDSHTPDRFRWLRNQLYNLFSSTLYVSERTFSDRRYFIEVTSVYNPERYDRHQTKGELTLSATTLNLPYAETIELKEVSGLEILVDGDLPIEPYRQDLIIYVNDVVGSTEYLELVNTTNGSHFKINDPVSSSESIEVNGVTVSIDNAQALRRTDKEFIYLSPGLNVLEINGADSANVSTQFRNYYR